MEYKQLVGKTNNGQFVHDNQGTAKEQGFSHVSQFWFPKTISFEDAIGNIEKERKNRRDVEGFWEEWSFVIDDNKLKFKDQDGVIYNPTPHALTQAMLYSSVSITHLNSIYLEPKEAPDKVDLQQLCDTLNHRKKRHHETNKQEPRELLFRTYSDNTLRAVMTTSYGIIDNVWFLEMLSGLIPEGRLSHQRGDADTLYANILLPDNVRDENDGKYGGMFSVRNSEIGKASLDTLPSLFRAICQNGCIFGREKGVNFRKVHKGEINLETLAIDIGENLDKQIKLLPSIMESFLKLRDYKLENVAISQVLAQVAKDGQMTPEQAKCMLNEWDINEGRNKTAFGVINAVTRMSQHYEADICNKFDIFGGNLVKANWNNIIINAKTIKEENLIKILGLSA